MRTENLAIRTPLDWCAAHGAAAAAIASGSATTLTAQRCSETSIDRVDRCLLSVAVSHRVLLSLAVGARLLSSSARRLYSSVLTQGAYNIHRRPSRGGTGGQVPHFQD